MSKVITLELKQNTSKLINSNGDYVSKVKELTIEEGDEIMLYKTYIDTQQSTSGRINLEQDLTIDLHYGIWQQNFYNNEKIYSNTGMDGNIYVLNTNTNIPGNVILTISFAYDGAGGESFGGIPVTFQYTSLDNSQHKITFNFPEENKDRSNTTTVNCDIAIKAGTSLTLLTSAQTLSNAHMVNKFTTTTGPGSLQNTLTPTIFDTQILIPAGNYQPDRLAQIITDELTKNSAELNLTNLPVTNPFLIPTNHANINFNNNNVELSGSVFVSNDLTKTYVYSTPRTYQYWLGASQMALEYLESGRFQFTFLHTPYYDTNGDIAVNYIQKKDGSGVLIPNEFFIASSNGGVFFQGIHCTYADGTDVNFFGDLLGFDMDSLLVKYTSNNNMPIPFPVGSKGSIFSNLEFGQTITKASTYADLGILKNDPSNPFYRVTVTSSMPPSSDNLVESITASKPISELSSYDFGYFMIEIGTNYNTELRNENTLNNMIKGVVGRYYEVNSYCQGASDSSFSYIHKGSPMVLNDFHIRILDSNRGLANNIGPDNTIFLQVIKK